MQRCRILILRGPTYTTRKSRKKSKYRNGVLDVWSSSLLQQIWVWKMIPGEYQGEQNVAGIILLFTLSFRCARHSRKWFHQGRNVKFLPWDFALSSQENSGKLQVERTPRSFWGPTVLEEFKPNHGLYGYSTSISYGGKSLSFSTGFLSSGQTCVQWCREKGKSPGSIYDHLNALNDRAYSYFLLRTSLTCYLTHRAAFRILKRPLKS